jgi:hypothetical protein
MPVIEKTKKSWNGNLFLEILVLSDSLGDGWPFGKAIISSDAILLILSGEVN